MKKSIFNFIVPAILLGLCFAVSPVQAQMSVGKAIISIGKVSTISKGGVETKLKRRGKVFEGDTIKVGNKSRLQIRFVDNQLVVLKANTVFRIDEYKFKDKNDQNKSAALSLLKGGMRSVTGLIGKSARDKYKVKTPVATMGVRGTHYVIQICSGQCGEGVQGIVGTVLEGQIVMSNNGGSQQFGTDQFFNVPSMDDAPTTMTNPPAVLISRAETSDDGTGDGDDDGSGDGDGAGDGNNDGTGFGDGTGDGSGDGTGDIGGPPPTLGQPGTPEPEPLPPRTPPTIKGTPAPPGALLVVAGITAGAKGAGGTVGRQGINNARIGIATVNGVGNQPVLLDSMGSAEFAVFEGAVATEQDGDMMIGVNWGRWASTDVLFKDNGGEDTLLTGIAFIYSDNVTPQSAIDTLAMMNYQTTYDFVAGPKILDERGIEVTGIIDIGVDFGQGVVTNYDGDLSGGGRNYGIFLDGASVSLAALASGGEIPLMSSCDGTGCMGISTLTGSAGLGFIGPNAEAILSYFGLNGTDGAGTNIGVSGAGLFIDFGCTMC